MNTTKHRTVRPGVVFALLLFVLPMAADETGTTTGSSCEFSAGEFSGGLTQTGLVETITANKQLKRRIPETAFPQECPRTKDGDSNGKKPFPAGDGWAIALLISFVSLLFGVGAIGFTFVLWQKLRESQQVNPTVRTGRLPPPQSGIDIEAVIGSVAFRRRLALEVKQVVESELILRKAQETKPSFQPDARLRGSADAPSTEPARPLIQLKPLVVALIKALAARIGDEDPTGTGAIEIKVAELASRMNPAMIIEDCHSLLQKLPLKLPLRILQRRSETGAGEPNYSIQVPLDGIATLISELEKIQKEIR